MKKHPSALLALLLFLSLACDSSAGLKIYYLRHAEAGHNVVKDWKNVPKDQWPAYVGNENMFTPKGETQAAAVPAKLSSYHFDFIAVSPMWRTRNTILPYLKTAKLQGELWPELHECPTPTLIDSPTLPPPSASLLNTGPEIKLPADETSYFRLRADTTREFNIIAKKDPQLSADMRSILSGAIERLVKRFGNTGQSVLLVGHGNNGRALLKLLVPKDAAGKGMPIDNTGIWMAEQQPDGTFRLMMLNDKPFGKH